MEALRGNQGPSVGALAWLSGSRCLRSARACAESNPPMASPCCAALLRKTASWESISAPRGTPQRRSWPLPTTAHVRKCWGPYARARTAEGESERSHCANSRALA